MLSDVMFFMLVTGMALAVFAAGMGICVGACQLVGWKKVFRLMGCEE